MEDRQPVSESNDETEPSSENSDQVLQVKSEEYGEASPTLDSPMSADAPEIQLFSDISAEESPPLEPIPVPYPTALKSFVNTFQSWVESSRPDLDPSDVSDANIIRSDPSPMKDGRNSDSSPLTQHSPDRLTKSPHRLEAGSRPISSSKELIADNGFELASLKRRRSVSPEFDYDESEIKDKSPASTLPPSATEESLNQSPMIGETQTNRNAVPESEELETSTSLRVSSHKKRKIIGSGCGDAFQPDLILPTSEDDTEQHSQLNLEDENVGSIVEECELTNEGEASTLSRGDFEDPDSITEHGNQAANFSNFPMDELGINIHSNIPTTPSLSCVNEISLMPEIRSPGPESSSVLHRSPNDAPVSERLAPSSADLDSVTEHSNPHNLHPNRSWIESLPVDTRDKDGTVASKPKVKRRRKLKTPFNKINYYIRFLRKRAASINLPEIHEGSISAPTQRPEVSMETDPPYIDVHAGQPSTSSYQPIITESSSEAAANETDTSPADLPPYVFPAGKLLLEIVEKLMSRNEIKLHCRLLHKFVNIIHKNPSPDGDRCLRHVTFEYQYQLNLDPRGKILNFENLECILLRIALESLVFTALRLSMNFEAIMANYRAFKKVYETCCEVLKDITAENAQGEDSSKRNKRIQAILLRMKVAFQLLLMHIGKHADLKSKQKYVKQLFGDDVKYLRRSI